MNSLEVIELLIQEGKDEIEIHKNILENDNSKRWFHNKQIKNCEEVINILQQIKIKLEALEVVKEELQIVGKTTNVYGEPLYRYELNVVGQDKINTLKKGLEVKDE